MVDSSLGEVLRLAETCEARPDDEHARLRLLGAVDAVLLGIDERIGAQLDLVMHAEAFQTLEGAWRGAWHLVSGLRSSDRTKVALWSISKEELLEDLSTPLSSSQTYAVLYTSELGQHGGEPYGAALLDMQVEATSRDIALLSGIASIAAAAHVCAFVGVRPSLVGVSSWAELRDATDVHDGPAFTAWNALRDREHARHVGLVLPRELGRLPYTERTGAVGYVETILASGHGLLWVTPVYSLGLRLARVFGRTGMLGTIVGDDSDGPKPMVACESLALGKLRYTRSLEAVIPSRVEHQLRDLGLMTFGQSGDRLVLESAHSLAKPKNFGRSERGRAATVSHLLGTRFPYLFIACRFAHYLKSIEREHVGRHLNAQEIERRLSEWLDRYVLNQDGAPPHVRAVHPLRAAEVVVRDVARSAGLVESYVRLRPHIHYLGVFLALDVRLSDSVASAQSSTDARMTERAP